MTERPGRAPATRYSYLSHLECSSCGREHDAFRIQGVCECGASLLARYDLEAVRADLPRDAISGRAPNLWRYHEVLPVVDSSNVITLGEGMTPLITLPTIGVEIDIPRLMMKDESRIPTGTFKGRGAAVGISRAKELGIGRVAMPTNGNAGAAWATYAARAGIESLIVMPKDAPEITRRECTASGAQLYLIDGLINDAGRATKQAIETDGWFDVATLHEPYRVEGKKTMGYEICEQLGWRVPDVILYPTGGGVGLIGIFKALNEMRDLGWIDAKMPRLVAVQAAGCAPIVEAWRAHANVSQAWPNAETVAFGINVPKAFADTLVLESIYATDGCSVSVDDEALLDDVLRLARIEGCYVCPEGAATLSAARMLRESGWIGAGEEVVLLNTGIGLKYPMTVAPKAQTVAVGEPFRPQ